MLNIEEAPLSQIRIILRLWDRPDHMGFAESRSEGGSIKDLKAKGIVKAQGKIGRRLRWKLVDGKIRKQDIDKMRELEKSIPLTSDKEALVVQLLGDARDLWILLAKDIGSKGSTYFLEHLFLNLRQMGYFFTEKSSPLFTYGKSLSDAELDVVTKITNIRHAIGHRESEKNYLTPMLKIVGGWNFKDGDVEIQYGQNRLYLLGEVFEIHRKLRKLFSSVTELGFLTRGYGWKSDEEKLDKAEKMLKDKLKDPVELLKKHRLFYGDI
jgi:hypothetical protein